MSLASHFACTVRAVNAEEKEAVLRVGHSPRTYLLIENRTSNAIYIAFDSRPDDSGVGIEIPAGGLYELENAVPQNAIHMIGDNASTVQNIHVTEGFAI